MASTRIPDIPHGKVRIESYSTAAPQCSFVKDCDTEGEAILIADGHNEKRTKRSDPEYLVFTDTYGLLRDARHFKPLPA